MEVSFVGSEVGEIASPSEIEIGEAVFSSDVPV